MINLAQGNDAILKEIEPLGPAVRIRRLPSMEAA
jgi:hypothetical protein